MRAVIQRVSRARVLVDGEPVGAVDRGVAILLGVKDGDTEEDARWLAEKCANLRIFENEQGKFDRSLLDVRGDALVVSQFTLYGDCRKGRRPSFTEAAAPAEAKALYETFIKNLREIGVHVETGKFGHRMRVEIHNDGPVTLLVDSEGR